VTKRDLADACVPTPTLLSERESLRLPDELLELGDFAFIDVETTGTRPLSSRLTEIAVIRFSHGKAPTCWQTLINPDTSIPAEIQSLTGISNDMVRDAPRFYEIQETLRELLADAFFVAHNARFDYGFIKNEFRRAGTSFTSDVLCTVRLSRKLYPEASGHGLDALIARHELRGFARHRAMGDVEATAAFVQYAASEHGAEITRTAIKSLLKVPSFPANLAANAMDDIPDSPGVYLFFGVNDLPIHIGKAKHLRERIRSHFSSDHMTANDIRLSQELQRIAWRPTAGEFSALLLESQLVKEKLPLHNIVLRRKEKLGFLSVTDGENLPIWVDANSVSSQSTLEPKAQYFGPFSDKAASKKWLLLAAREHQLCDHALGFSKPRPNNDPCFARQVGRCHGVCVGAETPAQHHDRLLAALAEKTLPVWPFVGVATFEERDVGNDRVDMLQFDQWRSVSGGALMPFDADVFKLLRRMLERNADGFSGIRKINE
jgi:DNA polymerase III subunit epsilon